MTRYGYHILIAFLIAIIPGAAPVSAIELTSQYATIICDDERLLQKFNNRIYLGSYSYLLRNKDIITISDEIIMKTDLIVDKVKTILDMYPRDLKFTIVVLESTRKVQDMYEQIYGKRVNFPAFYSPKKNTVFLAVKHLDLKVIAHEIAHVILETYFQVSPPVKVHELLARYAERHITD